jgi:hypothetical protein
MSLVHRYVPSDPLDPRSVIENSLRVTPTISARNWSKLAEEFSVLQEYYTRQQPPDFITAQLLGKAVKHCEDFDDQEVSLIEICKWMAEGIKKRYRHHIYLTLVQVGFFSMHCIPSHSFMIIFFSYICRIMKMLLPKQNAVFEWRPKNILQAYMKQVSASIRFILNRS